MTRGAWMLALFALGPCDPSQQQTPPVGVERYGLVESTGDHPLLEGAIETARIVLGEGAGIVPAPGWRSGNATGVVPVFAIVDDGIGAREIISVFRECGCIVVRAGALSEWLSIHTGSSSALVTIDSNFLLAYMLLHEIGHIHDEETAEAGDNINVVEQRVPPFSSGFNRSTTAQKERERKADRFAADAIRAALRDVGSKRGITGADVAIALSDLSWNLAAHRMLDHFAGTTLRDPALFWDAGLSHPNLELRVLVVNDLVQRTAASRQLLADFESARRVESAPIYQKRRGLD